MHNRDINGEKFVGVRVEFLAFKDYLIYGPVIFSDQFFNVALS